MARKNSYSLRCGKLHRELVKSLKIALLVAEKLHASERKTVVLVRKVS